MMMCSKNAEVKLFKSMQYVIFVICDKTFASGCITASGKTLKCNKVIQESRDCQVNNIVVMAFPYRFLLKSFMLICSQSSQSIANSLSLAFKESLQLSSLAGERHVCFQTCLLNILKH